MCDEQPVVVRKPKKPSGLQGVEEVCIVHVDHKMGDKTVRPLSKDSFRTIQDAVSVRQSQVSVSLRLDAVCANVPEHFDETHRVHRWCYKNYTNVSRMKKRKTRADADDKSDFFGSRTYSKIYQVSHIKWF
jgi:hypothetical protein